MRMEPLIVPGNLDSLPIIAKYVLDAAKAANLDNKRSYRLRLAVDEIVTNIVVYGYEEAGIEGNIAVRASVDDHALTIAIEDTARPFDPTARAAPDDLDAPLEQRSIGGLGIFLALNGVDDFRHESTERGNRNTLVIYSMNRD
jgi:serine/threonine-protein kinase RsbW